MDEKISQRRNKAGLDGYGLLRELFRLRLCGLVAVVLPLVTFPGAVEGSDRADLFKGSEPPGIEKGFPERCLLNPDPGPCKGLFWKYHLDRKSSTCQEFRYGGCDGVVPFETREECEQTCLGIQAVVANPAKATRALPSDRFQTVEVGSYFRCDVPPDWTRDEKRSDQEKTYGITLIAPESGEISVRISLYYYAEGNPLYQNVDRYLNVFAKPALGVALEGSSYGKVTPAKVGGREGMIFERRKQEFVPLLNSLGGPDDPGREGVVYERQRELMARAVPVQERFQVLPGRSGFYALRYSAPADRFFRYLPVFEQVTESFHPSR